MTGNGIRRVSTAPIHAGQTPSERKRLKRGKLFFGPGLQARVLGALAHGFKAVLGLLVSYLAFSTPSRASDGSLMELDGANAADSHGAFQRSAAARS